MSAFRLVLTAATLLSLPMGDALAYTYPGRPSCPWAFPTHTWAKYINRDYPDPSNAFAIYFTRDIGDLEGGACYTTSYLGNENWGSSGKIRGQNKDKYDGPRYGGNPTRYEMNVWGARFTFNEAGEVFYTVDGKLAGNLYCHIGSECWK